MESVLRSPGPPADRRDLVVRRLGRIGWHDARLLQERAARRVEEGAPDELLLVEHPPVVTVGRGGGAGQFHVGTGALRRRGVAVVEADRGGGVTYHGPGQLIGYPVVDLRRRGRGVRAWLRLLEAGLCRALRREGVEAGVVHGLTGVWVDGAKLVAIGIGVRRGVTRHGFALNVEPEPRVLEWIRPCGLDLPVTSLVELGWRGERWGLMRSVCRGLERVLLGRDVPGRRGKQWLPGAGLRNFDAGGFDGGGLDAGGSDARGLDARGLDARGLDARGLDARGLDDLGPAARGMAGVAEGRG